mmetsp:Transcript_39122/g.93684  ORF Transcript_39122/g.93684 Transcript_39122/m.93684 type:complete len:83 (-) Transcript_39122:2-250(-)
MSPSDDASAGSDRDPVLGARRSDTDGLLSDGGPEKDSAVWWARKARDAEATSVDSRGLLVRLMEARTIEGSSADLLPHFRDI